jgi:hypothetical protein
LDYSAARLLAAAAPGTTIRKTVPPVSVRASISSPPCARISSRAMTRPSPVPPARAEPAKGW